MVYFTLVYDDVFFTFKDAGLLHYLLVCVELYGFFPLFMVVFRMYILMTDKYLLPRKQRICSG